MPKKAIRRSRTTPTSAAPRARATAAPAKPAAAPKRARATAAPKPHATRATRGAITLTSSAGAVSFMPARTLAREAMSWAYRLRNRRRWLGRAETRLQMTKDCLATLESLGLARADLQALAAESLVEVAIPWRDDEGKDWDARVFPWEFMLTAATRALGRAQGLTVLRRLERRGAATPPDQEFGRARPRVLFVESAPGVLREQYDFEAERRMVESALAPADVRVLRDPTLEQLERAVREHAPALVHLAGFDTHQAFALLSESDPAQLPGDDEPAQAKAFQLDGYVLSHGRRPFAVGAEALGKALAAGRAKPRFVGCNLYDSALRIAPLLVAAGAGGALGFRDFQDDALMEMFFSRFYRAWRSGAGGALAGFTAGWEALRGQPQDLQGTNIALWTATSCLPSAGRAEQVRAALGRGDEAELTPPSSGLDQLVRVEVKETERINYSLLHNGGGLFEQFKIHKFRPGRMTDVSARVELVVGTQTFVHRSTFEVDTNPFDLRDQIHVPLAWELARELHEQVRSSLFVEVTWQDRVLKRVTLPVTLLPVSEWHDTPEHDPFLPSFVLPRDPAVLRIVSAAQRYLEALDDDPGAGFDGYQSYDATDRGAAIHRRVQAIWYAITRDLPVSYSDPPPVNSVESQRLRTPSEVLNGGRGTCIDLALTFAACLEYIDLYPVVFLLTDHAFPGYWRSEAERDRFLEVMDGHGDDRAAEGAAEGQRHAWAFGKGNLREVLHLVESKQVVPVETVDIGSRTSFDVARSDGRDHFSSLKKQAKILSMLDIGYARLHGVTPLPFPEGALLAKREG